MLRHPRPFVDQVEREVYPLVNAWHERGRDDLFVMLPEPLWDGLAEEYERERSGLAQLTTVTFCGYPTKRARHLRAPLVVAITARA